MLKLLSSSRVPTLYLDMPCIKDCLVIGNIKETKFSDLWYGQELRNLRNRFYKLETLPKICTKCEMYKPYEK